MRQNKRNKKIITILLALALVLSAFFADMSVALAEDIQPQPEVTGDVPEDIEGQDDLVIEEDDTQEGNLQMLSEPALKAASETPEASETSETPEMSEDPAAPETSESPKVAKAPAVPAIPAEDQLQQMIDDAAEPLTVDLSQFGESISFTKSINIPEGKVITLTAEKAISLSSETQEFYLFSVKKGGSLTLEGQITFDKSPAAECFGNLTINNDVVIKDVGTKSNLCCPVSVSGADGAFTMNGGTITGTKVKNSFCGAVRVSDSAKFEMKGGIIEKTTLTNQFQGTVLVQKDGQFTMWDGSIRDNSTVQMQSTGGVMLLALEAGTRTGKTAYFTMNGGTISGNTSAYGAGVYVYGGNAAYYSDLYSKAYFTMNDGSITGNTAVGIDNDGNGGGGGVYVECGGEAVMNGGSITNNKCYGNGGAVATYDQFVFIAGKCSYSYWGPDYETEGRKVKDWPNFFPAKFVFNGGDITGNTAIKKQGISGSAEDRGCGGGIYVASCGVKLNAGQIRDNIAEKHGGGVYVASVPYVLSMYDVLVEGNEASVRGGGIWLCPTGDIDSAVHNGGAVYGNKAGEIADDIMSENNAYKRSSITLDERILGGGSVKWYRDGAAKAGYTYGTVDDEIGRYDANSQENLVISPIKYNKDVLALKAVVDEEASKDLAKEKAKLFIQNNKAPYGAGIGSNGKVMIGKRYEATVEYKVIKKWNVEEGENTPESVTVWLVADGKRIEKAQLSARNEWEHVFTGLPSNVRYKIEEEVPSGWTAEYEYKNQFGDVQVTVTNTPEEPEEPPYTPPYTPPETPEPPTDTPEPEPPVEELDDDETPLSDKPDEPVDKPQREELKDEDVPLTEVPKTGDTTGLNGFMLLAFLSGSGAVILGLGKRKKETK